jgi:hypothetical protein
MAGSNLYGIGTINVPAGKKAKISISVKNSWLEDNGIFKISDFDVIFWAYYDDFKEWNTGKIKIKTNLYSKDEKYSPDGDKIYSDDNVVVWYLGNDKNKYYFSVKNKSDYNASYTVENCSINGWSYQLTNYTYDLNSVPLNSNSYDLFTLEIDNDFMEDSDISVIENIEFDVLLENEYSNSGDWWEHKTDKITIEN